MGLHDEQEDILGGPILQRPESSIFAVFFQYRIIFKLVTLLGLGLLLWIACSRGFEHLKKHRELRYRKAMRRKHGIPDSDCRPFAVAYAAAKRAHLEREAQDRKKTSNYVSNHNSSAVDQRINGQKGACLLRKRVPGTTPQLHDYHLPGKHVIVYDNKRLDVHAADFADRYNPSSRHRRAFLEPLPVERPRVCRTSAKEPAVDFDDPEGPRKRCFEDESDVERETIKKSRRNREDLEDGGEQADWYAQYSDRSSRRAESLDRQPGADHVYMNSQEALNRVNDFRDEDHEPDEAMEGIDEDKMTELKAVARGKKRDRAEAGSTFGGDDEEDARNGRASHHRKRRTILRRRMEIPARGQKRDREIESPGSEGEGVDSEASGGRPPRSSKKKRERKAASDEISEILVEDPLMSKDPLCGGRRVGEGWEADGVQYKVGDKGERLRLTLVKKARNKYHMPQDSQHPDRSVALEIYVEMWMTEEQYKQAEGRRELVWQEVPRELSGRKTPDVLDSPKNGKNLLWDSVKCSPARRPFRPSIPPGVSTRINPFGQWPPQPILGRRVASSSTMISPIPSGVVDNPARPGFRGFSKWEKQDREAEAMARIRAKIEEQKAQKSTEMPTSVTASELITKPLPVPTITLTPAPTAAADRKLDESAPQSKSNVLAFSLAAPTSSNDSTKGTTTVASTAAPSFSQSPTSIPVITPSTLFPGVTTPSTTSSTGSLSPFSFAKPTQAPLSTPTVVPSSAMSNTFGKGSSTGTPSSSVLSPSAPGVATQPRPPPTEGASEPLSFSFAKPNVSSLTTKSQAPIFNVTPRPPPTPVTSDSNPTTKAETQVPPPIVASSSTTESSKPTTPPFSFLGASSSSPTATHPTSSAPPVPKFSFGQSSAPSIFMPGPDPKPTFRFGQTPSTAADGAFVAPTTGEPKKSAVPASVFGTQTSLNEPAKPPSFGSTSAFGNSTLGSPLASGSGPLGKPVAVDSDFSSSTPSQSTLAPSNATVPSTHAGGPTSGNPLVFSFGSRSTEVSKPTPLFGGATGGPSPVSTFSANAAESKPTFTFGASNGPKPTSVFGDNTESLRPSPTSGSLAALGSKPMFPSGVCTETPSVLGNAVAGPNSKFAFNSTTNNKVTSGPTTESPKSHFAAVPDSSKPSNTTDPSRFIFNPGSTTFGTYFPPSSFTFGKKDDAATNTFAPSGTQTKPTTSFTLGTPSVATGSASSQPSAFPMSGNSGQSVFGKPTNAAPSAFGFAGTGGSNSSGTLTFGKSAAQNQKQEQ